MQREPTFLTLALLVCTLTLAAAAARFAYFQAFQYHAQRQRMLDAARNVAGWVGADASAVAANWDSQLVDVLNYMQRDADGAARLAVLDEDSERYVRLQNGDVSRAGFLFLLFLLLLTGGLVLLKQANLQPRTLARAIVDRLHAFGSK